MSKGVPVPNEKDYHGHPKYTRIYFMLLILFAVSLAAGYLDPMLSVFLIFATAIIKTALVVGNFMHLKFEPVYVWVAVGVFLFIVLALYFGMYLDFVVVNHEVSPY
jgi:caa(3)-type oxidase subunit IV